VGGKKKPYFGFFPDCPKREISCFKIGGFFNKIFRGKDKKFNSGEAPPTAGGDKNFRILLPRFSILA